MWQKGKRKTGTYLDVNYPDSNPAPKPHTIATVTAAAVMVLNNERFTYRWIDQPLISPSMQVMSRAMPLPLPLIEKAIYLQVD